MLTVEHRGHTSVGSVPLTPGPAVRDRLIQPEQLIVLAAVGGGMTWGSRLLRR